MEFAAELVAMGGILLFICLLLVLTSKLFIISRQIERISQMLRKSDDIQKAELQPKA